MRLKKKSWFLPWFSEGWIKQDLNTMFYFFFFFLFWLETRSKWDFFSPFSKDSRWTRNKHTFSKTSEPWHQNFLSSHTRVKLVLHTVGDSRLNWPQTWTCFYLIHSQYKVCSLELSLALWLLLLRVLWSHSVSSSVHLRGCLSSSPTVSLSFIFLLSTFCLSSSL